MQRQRPRSLRICVADDEPDLRRYYQLLIPRFGHEVVCAAADGQQLLEVCLACDPDLVITDVRMPKLDGLCAVAQIETPFIIISGQDEPDWIHQRFQGRLIAFLTKPIRGEDLQRALEAALRRIDGLTTPSADSGRK